MFITQCDLHNLIKWFNGSSYQVMALYLSGGDFNDNITLSKMIDNWRQIDSMSRDMVCYIYFDHNNYHDNNGCVMNFVSWVREYNCEDKRDFKKDADSALQITREICRHYGIFEYELPGLLFIDKVSGKYQLLPVSNFSEINKYLQIINIVSSYIHDISMAKWSVESTLSEINSTENNYNQQISEKENEYTKLEAQLLEVRNSLSNLMELNTSIIEEDYIIANNELKTFYEIANTANIPNNICNIQKIKKFIYKHDIKPSKEFYDALSNAHNAICKLAAKYHIRKEFIVSTINNNPSSWTEIISSEIESTKERLVSKVSKIIVTIDECKRLVADLKSARFNENELLLSKLDSSKSEFQLRSEKILNAYSYKLNNVTHLNIDVCLELLKPLNTNRLFDFIVSLSQKQIKFAEQQDIKYTLIKNAIEQNKYDVFISCKSEDYLEANKIYEFLKNIGKHPFLAYKSIDDNHYDEYNILIRETIDVCQDMIVYVSDPKFANTPYVSFEWNMFVNEKAAGRKVGNLIPIINKLSDIELLPIALRQCQACTFDNYETILPKYLQ